MKGLGGRALVCKISTSGIALIALTAELERDVEFCLSRVEFTPVYFLYGVFILDLHTLMYKSNKPVSSWIITALWGCVPKHHVCFHIYL